MQIPGLTVTQNSGDSNISIFSVRGINQGTLYGRNATGGLVHFISKRPTEEFDASLDITLGQYKQRKIIAAVGGALSDTVQGRFSFYTSQHDGCIKNSNGPDAREDDTTSFRAQLNFDLDDSNSLLGSFYGNKVDRPLGGVYHSEASELDANGFGIFCDGCGTFIDTNGDNIFEDNDGDGEVLAGSYDKLGMVFKETFGLTLNYVYENDNFTFTSVTNGTPSRKILKRKPTAI